MLPTLPWLYAQATGAAQLGLDFTSTVGNVGLRINFQKTIQFLAARDLAANFISEGRDQLVAQLAYMHYLAPIWLLLYLGSLLFLVWRVRRVVAKQRPLYLFLSIWYVFSFGFTIVTDASYTLVYYLPMLPVPCIALAVMWQQLTERRPQLRWLVASVLLVLCALNLNAVWSIEQYIRNEIRRMDITSHTLSLDQWVYPTPLVWQTEIAEEMRSLLDAGDASELIFLQYATPFEGQYRMRLPFMYHLRGYDVRVVSFSRPHLIYPERAALYLRNESDLRHNGDYVKEFEFRREVGPYHLYRLPGNVAPAPQFPLPERPGYANGLRLLGYDALRCDGKWQLHWTPGPPDKEGEPVHYFVHLLDASGVGLAHSDLRAYDIGDWRAGDHIIMTFGFGQELQGLPIKTIRVGLYSYSDEMKSFQEGIYALDEQGRPWEYAVDIPFAGECAA